MILKNGSGRKRTSIALTASNEEAQSFYRSVPDSEMKDIGIWINIR